MTLAVGFRASIRLIVHFLLQIAADLRRSDFKLSSIISLEISFEKSGMQ